MKSKIVSALAVIVSMVFVTACGQNGSQIPVYITEEIVESDAVDNEHTIFLIADSHISMCDEKDAELMEKATARAASFAADGIQAQDRFDAILKEANKSDNDMIIFAGDIIDSAMYASIEHIQKQFKKLSSPYLLLMGNHDFEYGSEYFSPKAYEEYLPRLDDMRDKTPYQIREYDDIIYFTADDENSQINQEILDAFKDTVTKNKPVVLSLHVPIEPITGDMSLVEKCKEVWGPSADNKSRVTMGINGCYPSPVTQEFIDLVTADDSPVVLVLAGHIHFYHKDLLNDKVVQIVTGAGFEGNAVKITLK